MILIVFGVSGMSLGVFVYAILFKENISLNNFYNDPGLVSLLLVAFGTLLFSISSMKKLRDNGK